MPGARRVVLVMFVLSVACGMRATEQAPAVPTTFAGRVAALSEPGGSFDTDNLISNERSYLHVIPALAPTRPGYLTRLTGREALDPTADAGDVAAIVAAVDRQPKLDPAGREALTLRIRETIDAFGVPLSDADHATIRRFHQRFIDAGLSLRFNSTGRPPQWDYPTGRRRPERRDRDAGDRVVSPGRAPGGVGVLHVKTSSSICSASAASSRSWPTSGACRSRRAP